MKSKAMVFQQDKEPLVLTEFDIPKLNEGEILVKILASGVCGSDVHLWKGEDPRTPKNMIPGHEGVGVIEEISGERKSVNGEQLKVGDRIIWDRGMPCGRCYYCKVLKQPSLCMERKVYGLNQSINDYPYLNGCYSEYIILTSGKDIFKIDEDIDPALLVTAACSGATVCHGFDMHRPSVGNQVLIVGDGPIGIYSVLLAKLSGAGKIIVTGGSEQRLSFCKEIGADEVINIKQTSLEERREMVLDLTSGRGADFCIEAAGYPESLQETLDLAGMGAVCLSYGFGQPMGTFPFDGHEHLVRKNLKLQGVWVSDTTHTYQAMSIVKNHQEVFRKMVTYRFPLEEANEAISVMEKQEAIKAVLLP